MMSRCLHRLGTGLRLGRWTCQPVARAAKAAWRECDAALAAGAGQIGTAGHRSGRDIAGPARFETGAEGAEALITDQGERHAFDFFAVTAGAWSHQLSGDLGDVFPLESERGYHMVLPNPGIRTSRPISFGERKFMCTTMESGLRLAGTVEFAGLNAAPNWGRADKLLTHAKEIFRDVDTNGAVPWMGNRPATPDSLPVISRSRRHKNVVYGFGHGHLGLTGGAITGKHLTALVAGRQPEIDLSPFSIGRYR